MILMIQNFDKSLFEIPSRGQHYSQQWLMEELSEEGTETARLHSGQNKDIQDETSERRERGEGAGERGQERERERVHVDRSE